VVVLALMVTFKAVLEAVDWLDNRDYFARLRANRRAAHRQVRQGGGHYSPA
jgi:hypothetical protein